LKEARLAAETRGEKRGIELGEIAGQIKLFRTIY